MSDWIRKDTLQATSPDGEILEVVEDYDENCDETGLIKVTQVTDSKTTEIKLTLDAAEALRDMLDEKIGQMEDAGVGGDDNDTPTKDPAPTVADA
jgi:hypothetical protein